MHSLVLITAMSATTGMFGGKGCGPAPRHHGRQAASACYSAAPRGPMMASCGTPSYGPSMTSARPYPASPQAGPAAPMAPMAPPTPSPSSTIPPAPAVPPAPPTAYYYPQAAPTLSYQAYYGPMAPTCSGCAVR